MNKFFYPVLVSIILLAGCNNATRIFDSEISAINRQTKVLEKQNRILERIATALEKHAAEKRGAK